jgi:hypothetical protein
MDLHTILPIATLIEEGLTLRLAPDFDPSIFVAFEPFVSSNREFDLEQEKSDLDRKVQSINAVLRARGEDPVPWGDEPVGKIGEVPYDATSFEITEDEPAALGAEVDEEEEEERALSGSRAAFFTPAAEWQRQVMREKKFIPLFLRAMQAIFRAQRIDVLKKLEALEERARVVTPEDIFPPGEWWKIFKLRVDPIREKAFVEIGSTTLAGLGVEETFIFTEAMQQALRQEGAQLVQTTYRTTKKRIARQLMLGAEAGEGIEQIAQRITGVFNGRRKEARTIARTEMLKASQKAQLEGFDQSGVVEKKRWNTSMDDAVRETHRNIEEPVVGLHDSFVLGDGERAEAPGVGLGGGALSAGNSINCRCFLTPVTEAT